MGAKTWMLVYADGDPRAAIAAGAPLDREATLQVAATLFPKDRLTPIGDGSLLDTCPPDDELVIGVFPGVTIVAAREFGQDRPSTLDARFLAAAGNRGVHLHAMHSAVDWFAFAVWRDGTLQRALSVSPDNGIIEDIGTRLAFEQPYWSGAHPAVDPADVDADEPAYPLPFHPLELGEAALGAFFGYQLEGVMDPTHIDPESVALLQFKRKKSPFKLW